MRISWIFSFGSMSFTQNTPSRSACRSVTSCSVSAAISGVSGAPAHSTSCTPSSNWDAALIRWPTPFWRVMRPTKATIGRDGSTPSSSSTDQPLASLDSSHVGRGYQRPGSMPLSTTWTRSGSMRGYASRIASFIRADTAMTPSAYSMVFFSDHDDTS